MPEQIIDRRISPRIRLAKKTGYTVTLYLERFFFKDRAIICTLRDISEGGASLLVSGEYAKYISKSDVGTGVKLLSENSGISFSLMRKGKVLRVIKDDGGISLVIIFK